VAPHPVQPSFPPVGWQPAPVGTALTFALAPMPQAPAVLVTPPAARPAKKQSTFMMMLLFVVMFLATTAGVGAITYVALRSGHAADRASASHSVD